MDQFNRLFQKSTENTTCELYNKMNFLVWLFAANLLTIDAILATSSSLTLLGFETSSQLSNKNLGIGDSTWITIAQEEVEHDIQSFFITVKKFYLATIQKML